MPGVTPWRSSRWTQFTGFKTAVAGELPDAVEVMDPFHVVWLADDALDRCRRRVQQAIHGHRSARTAWTFCCVARGLGRLVPEFTPAAGAHIERPIGLGRPDSSGGAIHNGAGDEYLLGLSSAGAV
jgi:hypothetical protein